jgi:hypothetical protein
MTCQYSSLPISVNSLRRNWTKGDWPKPKMSGDSKRLSVRRPTWFLFAFAAESTRRSSRLVQPRRQSQTRLNCGCYWISIT